MTLPCPNCKSTKVEKDLDGKRGVLYDELVDKIYRRKYICSDCHTNWYLLFTAEGEAWYENPEDEEMNNDMQMLED